MKKLALFLILMMAMAGVASADFDIYAGWVPEPNTAAVASQELWYDPDPGTGGDETMVWSGNATDSSADATITGNAPAGFEIWHRTKYTGGAPDIDTAHVSPAQVSGGVFVFQFFRSY